MVLTAFRLLVSDARLSVGSLPPAVPKSFWAFSGTCGRARALLATDGGHGASVSRTKAAFGCPGALRREIRLVGLDQDPVGGSPGRSPPQRVVPWIRDRARERHGEATPLPLVYLVRPLAEAVHHAVRAAREIDELAREGT